MGLYIKKIVFCNLNSLPPFQSGGAEETIDEMLMELSLNGYNVLALNSKEKYLLKNGQYEEVLCDKIEHINKKRYEKIFFTNNENLKRNAADIIRAYKPDYIFSQLNYLEELIMISVENHCKIVYFIHSCFQIGYSDNFNFHLLGHKIVHKVICLSKFIFNSLPDVLKQKSKTIYPIIPWQKYYTNKNMQRDGIVYFNPIAVKGCELVLELAQRLQREKFYIYETWQVTNPGIVKKCQEISNITLMSNSPDRKMYDRAKLYILPSQCEEGFGRGIIEANINGIPAIASEKGGIPEALGGYQMIVHNSMDITEWVTGIDKVLGEEYNKFCEYAKNNAKRFEHSDFIQIMERILGEYKSI